jgi:hypothetical protein
MQTQALPASLHLPDTDLPPRLTEQADGTHFPLGFILQSPDGRK